MLRGLHKDLQALKIRLVIFIIFLLLVNEYSLDLNDKHLNSRHFWDIKGRYLDISIIFNYMQ